MPTDPLQLTLSLFEICLLLAGTWLLLRLLLVPAQRSHWLGTNALPHWPVTLPEFGLFLALVFVAGFIGQYLARIMLGNYIAKAADREGLELFVYGVCFHGGALIGWLLFPALRRNLHADYGAEPPTESPAPAVPWLKVVLYASGALLVALPVLIILSLGWTLLLRELGLPDEPQDLIAVFSNTRSPAVVAGMFLVACVLAPLNEELLFRAGLYRYCRQKLGRSWALVISGGCFGALHANWASFLPLALLGMALALVYEATGSIRVSVIAHGLFNLNTILIILSGLQQ